MFQKNSCLKNTILTKFGQKNVKIPIFITILDTGKIQDFLGRDTGKIQDFFGGIQDSSIYFWQRCPGPGPNRSMTWWTMSVVDHVRGGPSPWWTTSVVDHVRGGPLFSMSVVDHVRGGPLFRTRTFRWCYVQIMNYGCTLIFFIKRDL